MSAPSPLLSDILTTGSIRVHLIGVAGSGMSGIAGLLLALGHTVSGSDHNRTVEISRLENLGLQFYPTQSADHLGSAELVIFSSAIRQGNPEYDAAIQSQCHLVRRADALAGLMHGKKGIVICGMHGKTTTSSMAAHVLKIGDLSPSHYVGAEIPILGTNAHWDPHGEHLVAEGDESDGTLALYHPEHAIVLNIEEEHLDYYADLPAIEAVFQKLLSQTRGTVFFCADDLHAPRICQDHPGAISYGEARGAFYRFDNLHTKDFQSSFRVLRDGLPLGAITLNVPGRHNVSNAVSVVALATELGIPFAKIAEALESFRGARRRFEIKYRSPRYMIVDDYGHHPSEIKATLATAKNTGRNRLLCVFQPHRYSRTHKLQDEFGRAFHDADLALITDIYAASEDPLPGISGQTIVDALVREGHDGASFQPDRKKTVIELGRQLQAGDCIVCLGAGNIHEVATQLTQDVQRLDELQDVVGPGLVKLYEPLSKHTTMRVGGPAQFWVEPETEEALACLVRYCSAADLPIFIIGRGSNLLVRDGGIRGVVVHLTRGEFKKLEVREGQIQAGVGVKQKELAYAARDAEIGGFEWFEGIPGDVGGALRMNAGALGGETFRQVVSVRYIDPQGNFHTKTPHEMEVDYRRCGTLEKNYAVSATFFGHPSTPEEIAEKLAQSTQKRRTSQPRESSAGCFFKNPALCPAGKLIEELGLKGLKIGGALVSEVHGNFLVNTGSATATDLINLLETIQSTALQERGIHLETEVQIVGTTKGLHE